jgi:hypothetical protein
MKPATPPTPYTIESRALHHLNQGQLARRWSISARTLERWRWLKQGPDYLKVGGRVLYRLDDVDAYETRHLRSVSATGQVDSEKNGSA